MRHIPYTKSYIVAESELAELFVEILDLQAMQTRLIARLESNVATMNEAHAAMLAMREVQLRMANFIGDDEQFVQAKADLIAALQEFA